MGVFILSLLNHLNTNDFRFNYSFNTRKKKLQKKTHEKERKFQYINNKNDYERHHDTGCKNICFTAFENIEGVQPSELLIEIFALLSDSCANDSF